jgi:hypothetical protein
MHTQGTRLTEAEFNNRLPILKAVLKAMLPGAEGVLYITVLDKDGNGNGDTITVAVDIDADELTPLANAG